MYLPRSFDDSKLAAILSFAILPSSNNTAELRAHFRPEFLNRLIGVPGRSNAFAISEHLGMDKAVVEHAKSIVNSDNRDFESVLEKLESSRQALEDERKVAEEMTARAKRIEEKAQSEKDKIETLKKRELDRADRKSVV